MQVFFDKLATLLQIQLQNFKFFFWHDTICHSGLPIFPAVCHRAFLLVPFIYQYQYYLITPIRDKQGLFLS